MAHEATNDMEPCPICGGHTRTPRFKVPFPAFGAAGRRGLALDEPADVPAWTICRCEQCTVEYACPRPSPESIRDYYASAEESDEWEVIHYLDPEGKHLYKTWAKTAEQLTRLLGRPGRLLDVGCAAGWLLKAARDLGGDVQGIDAAPKFHAFATGTLDVPVILGTTDALDNLPPASQDVVFMSDVIEHLQDPVADLRRIRRVIAPGGLLVLATCDIGSVAARYYGVRWRQVLVSHTFYWTRKAMTAALRNAGFDVRHFSDPRYWDPDPTRERKNYRKEFAKLFARVVLSHTYVPLARRAAVARRLPGWLTRGRVRHDDLLLKIGDQPVLSDVMLVVAQPAAAEVPANQPRRQEQPETRAHALV
jgi:2-polyprenyl-3-methyl-5-hydroxy-6-metoxy-1,4-benzoquinol methylase